MKSRIVPAVAFAAAVLACAPAFALGPVDVEAGVFYWASDTSVGDVKENSDAPGAWGEVWFAKKIGVAVSRYQARPDGVLDGQDANFTAIDLKWRFLSATRNNYFALGAGWEKADLADDSTSSVRLTAEGRVSIKVVSIYGRAAYLPSLADVDYGGGRLKGDKGREVEAGLAVKPVPFFYVYAGYKSNRLDFEDAATGVKANVEVKGPVAGVGFNF